MFPEQLASNAIDYTHNHTQLTVTNPHHRVIKHAARNLGYEYPPGFPPTATALCSTNSPRNTLDGCMLWEGGRRGRTIQAIGGAVRRSITSPLRAYETNTWCEPRSCESVR